MGLARKLQPGPLGGEWGTTSGAPTVRLPGGCQRAEGMVALLTWDDVTSAFAAAHADLVNAWLTLVSVSNGVHLLLLRGGWLVTVAPADHPLLLDAGFSWNPRPGEWTRRVHAGDADTIVRVLKGPLQVPHPRDLRFGLVAPDASRLRGMFGPLSQQQRRKGVGRVHTCARRPVGDGPPCRRCGRPLVEPVSVARGYGAICWAALQRR